jgi:DNA-binding SARP family transcriptional activator
MSEVEIQNPMALRFQLELFGGCRLADAQTNLAYHFRSRKARCLIGLVALWPDARMSREKLASFLWDPAPEAQARTSLRQCLLEIRESLGPAADSLIDASRLDVRILAENLSLDVAALRGGLAAAKADRNAALALAKLWKGELFGEIVPAAPVLEAWVRVERAGLRSMISGLLTDHLQHFVSANDYGNSDLAEELVRIESAHEFAFQYLMRFHAARGDQAGALRQFARLEKALADELDSEPSAETIDLLVAIKRGDSPSIAPAAAMLAPQGRRRGEADERGLPKIAIRPPLTRYGDTSKDYLADGFAGLLKLCMSRFRCWIIPSWPSAGFDSPVKIDYPDLAAKIGAEYVVDTVIDWRQPDGKLYVALVDCRDGSQIWTEIFPISADELQSMSHTVAGSISSRLASRIDHMTLVRFARTPQGDAAAYDLWLRGHQLSKLWSPEADVQAKDLFAQAIKKDPGLACAYASLASILNTQAMIRPGYANERADRNRALELSQNAVSLDPYDSRNHINMGWSWLLAGSGGRAFSHFKLATELNPYDSETLIASAMGMAFMGHIQLALEWSGTAIHLNPVYPEYYAGYLSAIQYLAGDFAGAVETLKASKELFPDRLGWNAAALAMLGEREKAAEAYIQFRDLVGRLWEGGILPSPAELHNWMLFQSTPVIWEEGRMSLMEGLRLARDFADAP